MPGRRSNPVLMITLCCFITLSSSLAIVCFVLPYAACLLDGDDDAGLTTVWPPVLIACTGADGDDTLMHNVAGTDDCCRVHPSTGGVVAVPTFVSTGAESPGHQLVIKAVVSHVLFGWRERELALRFFFFF